MLHLQRCRAVRRAGARRRVVPVAWRGGAVGRYSSHLFFYKHYVYLPVPRASPRTAQLATPHHT